MTFSEKMTVLYNSLLSFIYFTIVGTLGTTLSRTLEIIIREMIIR